MMKTNTAMAFPALFLCSAISEIAAENVALSKPVTLHGTFGSNPALALTVTDGIFLPKDTPWQDGTV
jgi:hypothetical protein